MLQLLFFGHTDNVALSLSHWLLQISAAVASILLFFLIYWVLPNRKLPVRAVLPTAIVIGLSWELAKMLYVAALPWMDLHSVYGPFSVSVSLMLWAFVTGLLLLAGAHYSASRHTLRLAYLADLERAKEEKKQSSQDTNWPNEEYGLRRTKADNPGLALGAYHCGKSHQACQTLVQIARAGAQSCIAKLKPAA